MQAPSQMNYHVFRIFTIFPNVEEIVCNSSPQEGYARNIFKLSAIPKLFENIITPVSTGFFET